MKQLESLLDLDALTVTGRTVRENLADVVVSDEDVIRPLDRPFSDKPPIVVLHGSLAPESAIVKLGVRGPGGRRGSTGTAIVYENGLDAIEGDREGRRHSRATCWSCAAWGRRADREWPDPRRAWCSRSTRPD